MENDIVKKYKDSLDSFIEKIRDDNHVIAALVAGSLSYDVVWRKSDIDLMLIVEDPKKPYNFYSFIENGIIINTSIFTRQQFKRRFEAALSSNQFHSFISKAQLLFTKDEAIREYFNNISAIGENDKEAHLLLYGTLAAAHLAKAQKWLVIKKDYMYSYLEIIKMLDILASIEVVMNGEIPIREVIHQALRYNREFFNSIYEDLAQTVKNEGIIEKVLLSIENYLEERTGILFRPILALLAEEGMVVGASELHKRLSMKVSIDEALLIEAFEWLAEKNIIQKLSSPVRVTAKSRNQVDEAAYYFDGDEVI